MNQLSRGALAVLVVLAALAVASATGAAASKVLVDGSDTHSDGAGCGSKANPCNTIQAGIDNAAPGATVQVKKGTYAGAVVNKAVDLKADGKVVINTGPFSHPGALRAGFLFNPDRSGSGASIEGFDFVGTVQTDFTDDGKLDFPIFSRGADNVTVSHNELTDSLQAVTDHNGAGWTIDHNKIQDLWTLCGGGIGIIVDGNNGTTAIQGNAVRENEVKGTLHVNPDDCGGYDGEGIVLGADFRWGSPGAPSVSGNLVDHNKVEFASDNPDVVDARGLEVSVSYDPVPEVIPTTISGNMISHNEVKNMTGNGIVVTAGTGGNVLDHNQFKHDTKTDAVDESTGGGTAGTANTWTHNECDTSSPPGLCH